MDADKYNREKIISDLAEIRSPYQKIEFLNKLKIDFLENTDQRYRLADALNQISKGGGLFAITNFNQWCDNKINDQIEILNTNGIVEFNFKKVYDSEVTPERKKTLKNEIEKIEGAENKIKFLENEKFNYLQNISSSTFEASGSISFPNFKVGEPLFWDRIIQLEIDNIKAKELDKQTLNHNDKPQSGTASKGQILETDRYEIIDLGKVLKSYKEFNNNLFEVNFDDYLACFNLSKPDPTHPIFKFRQQINFVYFLSQIRNVKKMDKIALSRFGIDNYYQQKGKANPNQVFKNRVATIFK